MTDLIVGNMYQDQEKIYTIRTLDCDVCEKYDSILLTERELLNKVTSNSLQIGSKILSHGDHLRIVYFDREGQYLGDTMSLDISNPRVGDVFSSDFRFLRKEQQKKLSITRRMLKLFTKSSHTISIIGPSMAGKTSLTMYLQSGVPERQTQRINRPATMGKSVKRFELARNKLTIIDLGGQQDFWTLWEDNIKRSDKIIYVLDGTANNISEIEKSLQIVKNSVREDQDLLIIFNKLDLFLEGYSPSFIEPYEIFTGR